MENPRLASRYAKSLIDISVERNNLEDTLNDIKLLDAICKQSHEFELMLKSPIVSAQKKLAVIEAVVAGQLHEITMSFIKLLLNKGREENLASIVNAFIEQYNEIKNIKTVSLTTASPVTEEAKKAIVGKVANFMPGTTIELKSAVEPELIGGFVLEVGDRLFDASIRKKLVDARTMVLDTSYVSKI